MPATDKYHAEPGFHFLEGVELVRQMKAGFQTEHVTDAAGLLTCAAAAIDSRPDGFGADGAGKRPAKLAGPKGEDLTALSSAQLAKLVEKNAPQAAPEGAVGAEAVPPWLAAAFTQMLVKAVIEYGPKLVDLLIKRKARPIETTGRVVE